MSSRTIKSKQILILGAGIVGRLAKIHMGSDAVVLEAKSKDSLFTADLGVQISIVPIQELDCQKYQRFIQIDGESPTLLSIEKYRRKIERAGELTYGDFRQFEPEQVVYKFKMPIMDHCDGVLYDKCVTKICLEEKKVFYTSDGTEFHDTYDILISTLPLIKFVELTNLFNHFRAQSRTFFMHRPIYILRSDHPTPNNIIRENYITDPDNPIYRENWVDGIHNSESLFKLGDGAIKVYPGKIYPNSSVPHLLEDLKSFDVHCVGRYAQWDNRVHLWNVNAYLKLLKEAI